MKRIILWVAALILAASCAERRIPMYGDGWNGETFTQEEIDRGIIYTEAYRQKMAREAAEEQQMRDRVAEEMDKVRQHQDNEREKTCPQKVRRAQGYYVKKGLDRKYPHYTMGQFAVWYAEEDYKAAEAFLIDFRLILEEARVRHPCKPQGGR